MDPQNPDYHVAGAWLGLRQRKWDLALRRAELALEIRPDSRPMQKACREIHRLVRIEKMKEKLTSLPLIGQILKHLPFLK